MSKLLEIMPFDEWLKIKEAATSTADVAGFSRITIPLIRRLFPNEVEDSKKKKVKQPQVEE